MSKKTVKALKIGILSSVIGGFVLWLLLGIWRRYGNKSFSWFPSAIKWSWNWVISSHSLPGWGWLIFFLSVVYGVINLLRVINKNSKPEYLSYREDTMFGIVWRWHWIKNRVSSLWGYCLFCNIRLIYYSHYQESTVFKCEHCNNFVGYPFDGPISQAIGKIEREIERKINTGEYRDRIDTGVIKK